MKIKDAVERTIRIESATVIRIEELGHTFSEYAREAIKRRLEEDW